MDVRGKKIMVNAASMLDLKAELYRKQEEFKKKKLQNYNTADTPRPKWKTETVLVPNLKKSDKSNPGVLERSQKDVEDIIEEQESLDKSRRALEAKTRLYDALSTRIPEDEENDQYLVDFQRKSISSILERKKAAEEQKLKAEELEDPDESSPMIDIPPPSGPDEEWVDYVDCFGRSRRCLQKDLRDLKQMDTDLGGQPEQTNTFVENHPDLLSVDMQREMQRKQWEKESEEEMAKPVGPVHYQKVQYQEIRDHGVGYFEFSMEEAERRKQLEMLNNLRKQTEDQRVQRETLKEKRKSMLQARLAKVKQRKKLKLGIVDDSDQESDSGSGNEDIESKTEEYSEAPIGPMPLLPELPDVKTSSHIRPWDKGKIGVRKDRQSGNMKTEYIMSGEQWLEQQRNERQTEFAPPQYYYTNERNYRPKQTFPTKKLWNNVYPATTNAGAFPETPMTAPAFADVCNNNDLNVSSIPLPPGEPNNEASVGSSTSVTEGQIDAMLKFYRDRSGNTCR